MSSPMITPSGQSIDLFFSDEEISRITEAYPNSAILEPGRYIKYDRGEGAERSTFNSYEHPEYEVFDSFSESSANVITDASTDDELIEFAKSHDLEFDQLRFTRDMMRAEANGKTIDTVSVVIPGASSHGYSHDQLFFDHARLVTTYPGIFNLDGSPKFMRAPVFTLKHRSPVVNVDGDRRPNDDLLELQVDFEDRVDRNKLISRFSIGNPLTGKGTFIEF